MSSPFLANVGWAPDVVTLDNVVTFFIQCRNSTGTLLIFFLILLLSFKFLQNVNLGEDSIISH